MSVRASDVCVIAVVFVVLGAVFLSSVEVRRVGQSRHHGRDILQEKVFEVERIRPKVSLSLSHSLLNNANALKHDPQSAMVANSAMLLKAVQDPKFQRQLEGMEEHRQNLYIQLLRKRGQIVALSEGGEAPVSFPQTPVRLPNTLKNKSPETWLKGELIWRNT